jgi:hypothetical protein
MLHSASQEQSALVTASQCTNKGDYESRDGEGDKYYLRQQRQAILLSL